MSLSVAFRVAVACSGGVRDLWQDKWNDGGNVVISHRCSALEVRLMSSCPSS